MQEWERWRLDAPMRYKSTQEMELWIAEEFDFLVSRFGKRDLNRDYRQHEAAVAELLQKVESFGQGLS